MNTWPQNFSLSTFTPTFITFLREGGFTPMELVKSVFFLYEIEKNGKFIWDKNELGH